MRYEFRNLVVVECCMNDSKKNLDDIAAKCGTRLQVGTICHFERIHLINVVLHQLLMLLLLLLQVPLNEILLELAELPINGWFTFSQSNDNETISIRKNAIFNRQQSQAH